ncbi:MAG: hypothetical protein KDC35_02320 [Acidobacteria bacterium]|nr:hypothetical protein [Acidobacteriota bacterium]
MSRIEVSTIGQFQKVYRQLKKHHILDRTKVVFCEGDSWFSTPLSMNILDWLVFELPGGDSPYKPVFGGGGLFLRKENSGDLAIDMFSKTKVKSLVRWYKAFEFDVVLLSGGGNDFVDEFLRRLFSGRHEMSVDDAFQHVIDSGRFEQVLKAYSHVLSEFARVRSKPIIAHGYDYPRLLGKKANLTLENIGLIAIFKKEIGAWIQQHIQVVLPNKNDQLVFVKRLIDGFYDRVLAVLKQKHPNFSYVDFRRTLDKDEYWHDEMHPTSEGFQILAHKMNAHINQILN